MRFKNSDEAYLYYKRSRYERAQGILRHVKPGPTVKHIQLLRSNGWTLNGIAVASGLSPQGVEGIFRSQTKNVHRDTEASILAVRVESVFSRPESAGRVPKIGAQRRIRALMAIGWRHSDLSTRLGSKSSNILHQEGETITRAKHNAVLRVYNELWDRPGPSQSTVERSARSGYLPPMAWDDGAIDDPSHVPVLDVERGEKHEANSKAFISEVEFFMSLGAGNQEVAERLDETPSSLASRLQRHGRDDLADLIKNSDQPVGIR